MNNFDISSLHRDRDECRDKDHDRDRDRDHDRDRDRDHDRDNDRDHDRDRDRDRDECRGRDRDDCRTVVRKSVGVRTPIAVDVTTRSGNARIVCSEPHITNGPSGSDRDSTRCEFTVSQIISVEIPLCYRVRTDVRSSYVDCDVDVEC